MIFTTVINPVASAPPTPADYLPNDTGGAGWRDGGFTTDLFAYGAPSANAYSGGNLTTISTDTGDEVVADSGGFGEPGPLRAGHRIRFQVPTSGCSKIEIIAKANADYAGAGPDLLLYIGKSGAWVLLDTAVSPGTSTATLEGEVTVDPEDCIDGSGYVYILVFGAVSAQIMTVDLEYAKLTFTP